jgi:fatty-acyl-CoA synthase
LTGEAYQSLDEVLEVTDGAGGTRVIPAPPFMHGAAHWLALNALCGGYTVVIPASTTTFDAAELLRTVRDEQANILLVVGDAFARPILDALEREPIELPSLVALISGGAALSAPVKQQLLAALPSVTVIDAVGASETGQQARQITGAGTTASTGTFSPTPGMCIVSEDLTHLLSVDDKELGWLAQTGHVPLGYLGDEAKTTRTFPTIDSQRYSVPGDRANYTAEGLLELHGRDSVTINSGGEKIFAEEVEAALAYHDAVYDSIVTGRPSERWGNEVVAVVQLRDGAEATPDELRAELERHLARYKLPKEFVFVDRVVRSPSGKADYRWAREQATKGRT